MAHTIYENSVLSNKLNEVLATKVDLNPYMTIDTSLSTAAGMKKIVNVYTASGNVQALAMGEGNTEEITVSFEPKEYDIVRHQGKFSYFDEQEMQDPMVVDAGLDGVAKQMINTFNDLAIAEFGKATLTAEGAYNFDTVVDALAKLGETQAEFMLINPASLAALINELIIVGLAESGNIQSTRPYLSKHIL